MRLFDLDNKGIDPYNLRLGRLDYFLSVQIVALGLYLFFVAVGYYNAHFNYMHIERAFQFTWPEAMWGFSFLLLTPLLGVYLLMLCYVLSKGCIILYPLLLLILLTLFFIVQTLRRCYDAMINFGFILIPMIPLALFFLKSKSRDNEEIELPLRTSTIRAGRICLIVILASLAYFIIQILVNRFYLQ